MSVGESSPDHKVASDQSRPQETFHQVHFSRYSSHARDVVDCILGANLSLMLNKKILQNADDVERELYCINLEHILLSHVPIDSKLMSSRPSGVQGTFIEQG
jgi:hypothetical protein